MDNKLTDVSRLKEWIEGAEKIFISTHKSPDGDAVGSSLALWHILKKQGKTATVVVPDTFPDFLAWMEGSDEILHFDKQGSEVVSRLKAADLVVSLDYNTLSRTGKNLEEILRGNDTPRVILDHHREPEVDAFEAGLHDITSSSTAQLVYEYIVQSGSEDLIDATVAECLYSGMVTDTGSFRFPSTTARTHRIVANLMDVGLDVSKVYNLIYDTNALTKLRLLGYILDQKLEVFPEADLALITLSEEELRKFDYQPGDTEGVVNYALSIKGVRFSCLMKQSDKGIRMSFRSKGNLDVNTFARTHFNGGGHLNAAGGFSADSLELTRSLFIERAKAYVQA